MRRGAEARSFPSPYDRNRLVAPALVEKGYSNLSEPPGDALELHRLTGLIHDAGSEGRLIMSSNLEKYKIDLEKLIKLGDEMSMDLQIRAIEREDDLDERFREAKKRTGGSFEKNYQRWYTEAQAVVRQIISARLPEFEEIYRHNSKSQQVNVTTFSIQNWLFGMRSENFDDFGIIVMKFNVQLDILKSASRRFETSLFDIKQIVQADLFDSELDAGKELLNNGFLRGAGAIAGVVIEKHLGQVCANHDLATRKKNPTISDLNELLKENEIVDVPTWRFIQRLADLRNLCDPNKKREPTDGEVAELINGSEKIVKTLF
jgi:hypothetical protein